MIKSGPVKIAFEQLADLENKRGQTHKFLTGKELNLRMNVFLCAFASLRERFRCFTRLIPKVKLISPKAAKIYNFLLFDPHNPFI
jgi:hypothetical protein